MSGTETVLDTLRDMWVNRPERPREGRKVAGVSAAIGLRYGIDPVLVRVAFVVATVPGGAGLLLYLLGWLVLPAEEPRATSGTRQVLSVLGVVALVLFVLPIALSMMYPAGWLTVFAAFAGLYLLHRNYRDRAVPSAPAATPTPDDENTWVYPGTGRSEQPGWDPLGAAPFAWDLPDPPSEARQEPVPQKRRWITWVTLTAAALAGAAMLYAGSDGSTAFAVALGVLGAGMVTGAFLHGSRALIAFALPVGALALLLGGAEHDWQQHMDHSPSPRNITVTATTPDALRDSYRVPNGAISLDLRPMRLTGDEHVQTRASAHNGRIQVLVPPTADVTAHCATDRGALRCLGNQASGADDSDVDITDVGPDGPGGGRITLDLTARNGLVEVHRG